VPGRCAQVGAEIVRRALSYPLRLIANNAGVNGSVVQQKVLENLDANIGYNAATDVYEDLMAAGIIDPTKVIEHSAENSTLLGQWHTASNQT
jgi:chaperonin GroEL